MIRLKVAAKGIFAAVVFACAVARADVVYVWSGATGKGTGESWANACTTFAEGFAKAAGGGELWVAGDQTVTSLTTVKATGSVIVRGGFSGTSPESTAAARAAGAVSTVTANDACNILTLGVADGFQVTFERMVFTHALKRAVEVVDCPGDLAFHDCQFLANAVKPGLGSDNTGRGLCVKGTSASKLAGLVTLSNCIFRANAATITNVTWNSGNGAGIWMQYGKGLVIDDSTFVTNGNAFAGGFGFGDDPSRDGTSGSAIYVEKSSNVVVRGSTFRGNRATHRNKMGGTVRLEGVTGAAAFTNCLFVGNEDPGSFGVTQTSVCSGSIVANLATSETPLSIDTCTFAYNIGDSPYGPGGVSVVKGAATIRNSIFYGNLRSRDGTSGADLVVAEEGSAVVDYTLFTTSGVASVTAVGSLVLGTHLVYGDPQFVTPIADFQALIVDGVSSGRYAFDRTSHETVVAFDVHLKSKSGYWLNDGTSATATVNSPALDAADPTVDYSKEPKPNGSRRNLGGYANTARASKSNPVAPAIGAFTATFPDGYTRPSFSVTFTAASSGDWTGSAELAYGTGTVGSVVYAYTNDIGTVRNGETVTSLGKTMFEPGATLFARVTVRTATASAAKDLSSVTVTGEIPAWWDVTCPAHAIAVCAEAFGSGDGSRWRDACTTLSEAYALSLLDPTKTEIWIAGDLAMTADPATFAFTRELTIRGGFTRLESAADERTPGSRSTLDGAESFDILKFQNSEPLAFEAIEFTRANRTALAKTGGDGNVTVANCRFYRNGLWPADGVGLGNGCSFAGSAAAEVTVTNCLFEGNFIRNDRGATGRGGAIYANGLRRLIVDDSLFLTNGLDIAWSQGYPTPGCEGYAGAAIYADSTPTTIRRSQFRGNRAVSRRDSAMYGGTVRFNGACGGSALTNCLFTGNSCTTGGGEKPYRCGTIVVDCSDVLNQIDIDSTTLAYNLGGSEYSGAGLTVIKGSVHVVNSILYGNFRQLKSTAGADLFVYSTGAATVSDSLLTSNNTASVSVLDGGSIAYGTGVLANVSPALVTPYADFRSLVKCTTSDANPYFDRTDATREAIVAFNAHLRGAGYVDEFTGLVTTRYPKTEDSPAIDAGNPSDPLWRLEPRLNGQRLNLGAYGGTPHATKSRGYGFTIIGR